MKNRTFLRFFAAQFVSSLGDWIGVIAIAVFAQGLAGNAGVGLVMTARVLPEFTEAGLARMMVQSVAADLSRRGVRAIEAFGRVEPGAEADASAAGQAARRPAACLVPADFLLAVGFKTVRPHHRFPRLRLDLRTAVSWRADVEVALERLLGSMSPEPSLRPV